MHVRRRILVPATLAVALVTAVLVFGLDLAPRLVEPSQPAIADGGATNTPTTRARSARSRPTAVPTPSEIREAPAAGGLIQQFVDVHFGHDGRETSWHENIERITVRSGTAIVQTDLDDTPGDRRKAKAISRAVLHFRETEWGQQMSGLTVEVYDQQGQLLVQQSGTAPLGRAR